MPIKTDLRDDLDAMNTFGRNHIFPQIVQSFERVWRAEITGRAATVASISFVEAVGKPGDSTVSIRHIKLFLVLGID